MQQAGDATSEEVAPTPPVAGIMRWFPEGFRTDGVDWVSFGEHLAMVPDIAFEVTRGSRCGSNACVTSPKGVCAIHFVVSCWHPAAPVSLVQSLIDVNPDALHQTEENTGWNVLHCALKFNQSLSSDHSVLQLLIHSRPELVTEVTTALEDFGLPPLAYANCKEVVPSLVKLMSPTAITSILRKIFSHRRLVGGSLEAMEQIIKEVSKLEIQQGRPILVPGIVPQKIARKQSLIEYALNQAAKRRASSQERLDLMCLIDRIIQATFCLCFRKDGDDDECALSRSPTPLESLKTLVAQFKIKRKALDLYETLLHGGKTNDESTASVESGYINSFLPVQNSIHDPDTLSEDVKNRVAREMQRGQPPETEITDPFVKLRLEKLLGCKREFDAKIDRSFDVLRRTVVSLEGYKERYSKAVDTLCAEAKAMPCGWKSYANTKIATIQTSGGSSDDKISDENVASVVAKSVLPPNPPGRTQSDLSLDSKRQQLEQTVLDTIENLKTATSALDIYNKNLNNESNAFVKDQEDQMTFDLSFFRSSEHEQAVQAVRRVHECQTQRETIAKGIADIKEQLRTSKSRNVDCRELNSRWSHQKSKLRIVQHQMASYHRILTHRRQEVGRLMMKARRALKEGKCSKTSRSQAGRFLCESKKEMQCLLSTLQKISLPSLNKGCSMTRRHKQRRFRQKQLSDEDEELTRMAKRMRL